MSAAEDTKSTISAKQVKSDSLPLVTPLVNLLSSVRFGVTLLIILVVLCMVGMLIMQQNIDGFAEYYTQLTPSQKLVYGKLGFFDMYHTWYFNLLLLTLSLNIVLASIDRFPTAWKYISSPKLEASKAYILHQNQNATIELEGRDEDEIARRVAEGCQSVGFKTTITERLGRKYVFAQRGAWNRLGAYAVHVGLLTIFLGGFMTTQFGRTGTMQLAPGLSSSQMFENVFVLDQIGRAAIELPFTVTCTDIQQKLIKKDGTIQASNTLDWLTRIKIKDETGEREALVHLNHPYDYRGYRFFQASFISFGMARNITVSIEPEGGGAARTVTIPRDGSVALNDGTHIKFENFYPDFVFNGKPDSASDNYNNPVAELRLIGNDGSEATVFATSVDETNRSRARGYLFRLKDFEKSTTCTRSLYSA
jgi:cytochrome c biogenesis protein